MILTHNEVAHHVNTIIENGSLDKVQVVLANIGYTPRVLQRGRKLITNWENAMDKRDDLNRVRLEWSKRKEELGREMELQVNSLRENVDELLDKNDHTATLLERTWIVKDGKRQVSKREADVISDNRHLVNRVLALPTLEKRRLARYGWHERRLRATKRLINVCVKASQAHSDTNGRKLAATVKYQKAFAEMDAWLRRAVRLIRCELKIVDPDNALRIVGLLKLPIKYPSMQGKNKKNGAKPRRTPAKVRKPNLTPIEDRAPDEPIEEVKIEDHQSIDKVETPDEPAVEPEGVIQKPPAKTRGSNVTMSAKDKRARRKKKKRR